MHYLADPKFLIGFKIFYLFGKLCIPEKHIRQYYNECVLYKLNLVKEHNVQPQNSGNQQWSFRKIGFNGWSVPTWPILASKAYFVWFILFMYCHSFEVQPQCIISQRTGTSPWTLWNCNEQALAVICFIVLFIRIWRDNSREKKFFFLLSIFSK